MKDKNLCIYHGGCTDGVAAAWTFHEAYPEAQFFAGVYQSPPPFDLITPETHVFFIDFSYKQDVMREVYRAAKAVTVLDHHKTAEADLAPLFSEGLIDGLFDMDRCGALITWDYLFATEPPKLLREIDKQDRWLDDRDSALIMALRSYPHQPKDGDYKKLFADWSFLMTDEGIVLLHQDGQAIFRYYRQRVDETKGHERFITLADVVFPIINAPFFMASDVAGELAEEHDGVGACWWMNKDGSVTFSLRSRGDTDVSEIAKIYGGGGHRNAAGFKHPSIVILRSSFSKV